MCPISSTPSSTLWTAILPASTLNEFVTHVGFHGLAKLHSGNWSGIEAKQQVVWQNVGTEQAPSWQITRWETDHVDTTHVQNLAVSRGPGHRVAGSK